MSTPADDLSDSRIVALVATFLADLQHTPTLMRISAWMDGCWLSASSIKASGVVLRRPKSEDFEAETDVQMRLMPVDHLAPETPRGPVTAEFEIRAATMQEARDTVGVFVNALRLYRLGSVYVSWYRVQPTSILRIGGVFGGGLDRGGHYKYELGAADEAPLTEFLKRMQPLMPSVFEPHALAQTPVLIGLRRFSAAVIGPNDIQERITSGITCLEALFLRDKERSELSFRLSQRVAALLRLLGHNGIMVQGEVHEAYGIRSEYIHGGAGDPSKAQHNEKLCRQILDYARVALIVFLQIETMMSKSELLNRLDEGLLEERRLEKLKAVLASVFLPPTSQG
ncbi:MAG: hypothetical protein ABSH42_13045 [Bryobacteraceae bacterium]